MQSATSWARAVLNISRTFSGKTSNLSPSHVNSHLFSPRREEGGQLGVLLHFVHWKEHGAVELSQIAVHM
jgi:hypothetical protein